MLKHLGKEHLGDSKLVKLTLAGMLVALAVFVLLWPARDGQPIEQPVPAPVKPADLVSDTGSLDLAPVVGKMELEGRPNEGSDLVDGRAEEPHKVDPDDNRATVQDGNPNETRDPEVPVTQPPRPDANVVDGWPNQTRDPDVEIRIPPLGD